MIGPHDAIDGLLSFQQHFRFHFCKGFQPQLVAHGLCGSMGKVSNSWLPHPFTVFSATCTNRPSWTRMEPGPQTELKRNGSESPNQRGKDFPRVAVATAECARALAWTLKCESKSYSWSKLRTTFRAFIDNSSLMCHAVKRFFQPWNIYICTTFFQYQYSFKTTSDIVKKLTTMHLSVLLRKLIVIRTIFQSHSVFSIFFVYIFKFT